jgi:hypothetical protein
VPDIPAGGPPPVSIEFGSLEWEEEVERYTPRSAARTQAQNARKAIEAGTAKLDWKRCKADGPGGTKLPGCRKLYLPLGKQGASEAPYGFVFQLIQKPEDSLAWNLVAFGERHPANERTRDVYERAHRRLHGRYP